MTRKSLTLLFLFLALLSISGLACRALIPGSAAPQPTSPALLPALATAAPLPSSNQPQPPITFSSSEEALLIELYQRVNTSVVNITVYEVANGDIVNASQGSGFVFDTQGNIITNAHVVHGNAQFRVTFVGGVMRDATLVGEDLHSDLAVLRVDNLPAGAAPLPLGNMDELRVGQNVVAIGNPFGLEGTLTRGIISALGRTIPALTVFSIPQSIQTDAAINPGNSGGPLLNLRGEVIGVNAQIETNGVDRGNIGIGFAIPVSIVQRVVPGLIADGKYAWSWLGVSGSSLDLSLIEAMKLPVETGAYLVQIVDGGPADKAGLHGSNRTVQVDGLETPIGGDVITAIDGQPVHSFDDVLVYIALKASPGQTITLTILRDGKPMDVQVKLEPRPDNLQN